MNLQEKIDQINGFIKNRDYRVECRYGILMTFSINTEIKYDADEDEWIISCYALSSCKLQALLDDKRIKVYKVTEIPL